MNAKTLNMLEMVYRSENKITISNIDKISDIPSEDVLELLLNNIMPLPVFPVCMLFIMPGCAACTHVHNGIRLRN